VVDETLIERREDGKQVFAGTQVPVQTLIVYLAAGDTLSGFLDDFPDVNRAQALAALQIARDSLSAAHHSEHTRDVPRLSETIDELSESGSVSTGDLDSD